MTDEKKIELLKTMARNGDQRGIADVIKSDFPGLEVVNFAGNLLTDQSLWREIAENQHGYISWLAASSLDEREPINKGMIEKVLGRSNPSLQYPIKYSTNQKFLAFIVITQGLKYDAEMAFDKLASLPNVDRSTWGKIADKALNPLFRDAAAEQIEKIDQSIRAKLKSKPNNGLTKILRVLHISRG